MSIYVLLERAEAHNFAILQRYLKFMSSRTGQYVKGRTHLHHILPKASDFYSQYSSIADHPWNGVHLTHREHFIAHWMLARAFPSSSQSRAFYHMSNKLGRTQSRLYAAARLTHIDKVIAMTQDPDRNRKISNSLTGVKKSSSHIKKMLGHLVAEETRQKLREANLGKKHSEESKLQMSATRTGKSRQPHTDEGKRRISETKKSQGKHWFNDGVTSQLFTTPPDCSWVPGRLQWK